MDKSVVEVSKVSYHESNKTILNNVSFHINSGEIIALLGSNGAGKSTLIDLILSDLKPTKGTIVYPAHSSFYRLKKKLGVVYDIVPLHSYLKVQEIIKLYAAYYKVRLSETTYLVDILEIGPLMNKLFYELSSGERKKIGVFIAFFHYPELIVMDEPTGDLDPIISQRLWNNLFTKDNFNSLFFSTHRWLEAIEYADRILLLKNGEIQNEVTRESVNGLLGNKKIVVSKLTLNEEELSVELNSLDRISQDNTITFYPSNDELGNVVSEISKHTLNFSVQETTLEDHYLRL